MVKNDFLSTVSCLPRRLALASFPHSPIRYAYQQIGEINWLWKCCQIPICHLSGQSCPCWAPPSFTGHTWLISFHFLLKFCRTLRIWEAGHFFGKRKTSTLIRYIPVSYLLFRYVQSHLHHKREAWGQNHSHIPQDKDMITDVSTFWVVLFGFWPSSH